LSRAMEAALPIAEVLSARASGGEGRLAGPVAKRALAFAAKHPDFPPSRVLRLLALALSGDRKGAEAEAERVLGAKDAPALARRWADRIARKLPPFDR
ncbi:MAG TPA: hypothetical protein PLU22_28025, partial [Polyangiaceae bacterium]|nr:hypothetical protein [Polyangiaceae bacterium]